MNAILTLVFLKSFVIRLVSFPTYVSLAHIFGWFSESGLVLLFLILLKMEVWNLLFYTICIKVSVSFCFSAWPKSNVFILFINYWIAANFCSDG